MHLPSNAVVRVGGCGGGGSGLATRTTDIGVRKKHRMVLLVLLRVARKQSKAQR